MGHAVPSSDGMVLVPSCPKTQTNSRLARRAVSIVIDPWRAPDLGRVGGDGRRFGFPVRAGKTPSSNGDATLPGEGLDPGLGKDGHQGGPGRTWTRTC